MAINIILRLRWFSSWSLNQSLLTESGMWPVSPARLLLQVLAPQTVLLSHPNQRLSSRDCHSFAVNWCETFSLPDTCIVAVSKLNYLLPGSQFLGEKQVVASEYHHSASLPSFMNWDFFPPLSGFKMTEELISDCCQKAFWVVFWNTCLVA